MVHLKVRGKIRDLFLCVFSAALLVLSFSKFNLGFLVWVGFVPFLLAIENRTRGKAFLLGFFCGMLFWLSLIYWIAYVSLLGMILMVLILSFFFGIFALIVRDHKLRGGRLDILFIPCLWAVLDYSRSCLFTGFPWAALGYSQYLNLPLIQIADITGAWGVSFMIMMVNVALEKIALAAQGGSRRQAFPWSVSIVTCAIWLVVFSYGTYKIRQEPEKGKTRPLTVSAVQGNITRALKDNPATHDHIAHKYFAFTAQALRDDPDLVIWPEAAFGAALEDEPRQYEKTVDFVRSARFPLLLGLLTVHGKNYFNSALFISPDGELLGKHNKIHLVPFSEYVPLRPIFGLTPRFTYAGKIKPGKEYTVFSYKTWKFSVLICFEDIFPALCRQFVKKGADFLVNIVDDSWFRRSPEPYQHLQAAVFRAVENRVFLVRSANSGPTAFISPKGKILSVFKDEAGQEIFVEGSITAQLGIHEREMTFYTRQGDIFILLCAIFLIISTARHARRREGFFNVTAHLKVNT